MLSCKRFWPSNRKKWMQNSAGFAWNWFLLRWRSRLEVAHVKNLSSRRSFSLASRPTVEPLFQHAMSALWRGEARRVSLCFGVYLGGVEVTSERIPPLRAVSPRVPWSRWTTLAAWEPSLRHESRRCDTVCHPQSATASWSPEDMLDNPSSTL